MEGAGGAWVDPNDNVVVEDGNFALAIDGLRVTESRESNFINEF